MPFLPTASSGASWNDFVNFIHREGRHVRMRWLVWLYLLVGVVLWTAVGWAQQPRHRGTLRIAFPGDPAFFDANQGPAPGAQAYWLSNSIYNSLLTLTPPPELKIA